MSVLAACSSFVYGLHVARGLVASRIHSRVLVVAAEYFTCGVDYSIPENSFFWGDGAVAVVVEAADVGSTKGGYAIERTRCTSILSQNIRTGLGGTRPLVARMRDGGGPDPADSRTADVMPGDASYPFFWQDGRQVFREVVPLVANEVRQVLREEGLTLDDVSQFMFHQPSALFLGSIVAKLLGSRLPNERVPVNFDKYGNTSSCGAAICLAEETRMNPGELACMTVFGAGYTAGSALLRKLD